MSAGIYQGRMMEEPFDELVLTVNTDGTAMLLRRAHPARAFSPLARFRPTPPGATLPVSFDVPLDGVSDVPFDVQIDVEEPPC